MYYLKNSPTYILALFLSLVSIQVGADTGRDEGLTTSTILIAQSSGISADSAAALVRKSTGGRILSVNRSEKKGVAVYRVKVLMSDGRVRVISVNAKTGQING